MSPKATADEAVTAALDQAAKVLAGARSVLLTSHRRPDGDGTGSMVALASLLRAAGKNAVLFSPDLIPRKYRWLPLVKTLVHKISAGTRFDATVVVDCADRALLGDALPAAEVIGTLISLDHHAAGVPFGDVSVCDPQAAAVSVLVARLAERLGWPLTPDAATAMYVSLISDTGWFRHANTNAEALQLASQLVAIGARPAMIAGKLEERSTPGRLRLLGATLGTLDIACNGKVAMLTVTAPMVEATGGSWDDVEGMVYWARGLDKAVVGVVFTTARGGGIRVSMRARDSALDVGAVCQTLGGGGHPGAAGCHLDTDLAGARERVVAALTLAIAGETGGKEQEV